MALTTLQGFSQPNSVEEAVAILQACQDSAMVIGGGTFIHGLVARGLVTDVEQLIDLSRLNLNHMTFDENVIRLGASTSFASLEASAEIQNISLLGALREAIAYPPRQVKNAATIGGGVAASCPYLDMPIAFLALDAMVCATGPDGTREFPIDELFVSLFETNLIPGEIITEIKVPQPSEQSASSFEKMETTANDLSIVSVGVRLSLSGGSQSGARIFVGGGIGEVPFRCCEAEAVLENSELNAEDIKRAATAAKGEIEPFSDHRASAQYRKHITGVLVRRCLARVANQLS